MQAVDAIRAIAEKRGDAIAVPTMTNVAAWHEYAPGELTVSCVGFMGGASSLGLGLALAQPERRVIVLDGDGSLLMQLGTLATIAGAAPPNLYHFVFKNGVYSVSGSQSLPASERLDFAAMATGAGYPAAFTFNDLESLRVGLDAVFATRGPALIQLITEEVTERPTGGVIGASFRAEARTAREALARTAG